LKTVTLDGIKDGIPDLTKNWALERYDAALICLDHNNNKSGTTLDIEGVVEESVELRWSGNITSQMVNTWNDMQEATEKGAEGIAALLALNYTEYTIVMRSAKGEGIDYWLGDKESNFPQFDARLEVSGLLKSNNSSFRQRIKEKREQAGQFNENNLPSYVAVVEFQTPKTAFIKI